MKLLGLIDFFEMLMSRYKKLETNYGRLIFGILFLNVILFIVFI